MRAAGFASGLAVVAVVGAIAYLVTSGGTTRSARSGRNNPTAVGQLTLLPGQRSRWVENLAQIRRGDREDTVRRLLGNYHAVFREHGELVWVYPLLGGVTSRISVTFRHDRVVRMTSLIPTMADVPSSGPVATLLPCVWRGGAVVPGCGSILHR